MMKVDKVAEEAIVNTIEKSGITCTIVSEESGTLKVGLHPQELYVITDPLDGTTNALQGIPFVATSIALADGPRLKSVKAALVADVIHDEVYTAQKGGGAYRNGERVRPSDTPTLRDAIVGLDLGAYKAAELAAKLTKLLKRTRHLRHLGANALELCYVADGRVDAFVDLRGKLRVTDVAAAYLIVNEAGAIITTPLGDELDAPARLRQRVSFVAASNKRLHEEIMKLLKR